MDQEHVTEVLSQPLAQELLASTTPARLAYVGRDGDPRVVPVGFWWSGSTVVVGTVPAAAKVAAIRAHPRVALTVDTEGFPPKALLVRGAASIEIVDEVPAEYLAGGRKLLDEEQYPAWEAGVRHLYQRMALIRVAPDHAVLLDFETTLPKSVADLVATHGDPR